MLKKQKTRCDNMKKLTHKDIKELLSGYFCIKNTETIRKQSNLKEHLLYSNVPFDVHNLVLANNTFLSTYTNFHKNKKTNEISNFRIFSRLKKLKSSTN